MHVIAMLRIGNFKRDQEVYYRLKSQVVDFETERILLMLRAS